MSNPWKPIVDKVPNKTTSPNQIILSTPFLLSSLTKKIAYITQERSQKIK